MNIRQIFQPLALRHFDIITTFNKFDEFITLIEPDFNEETECRDLSDSDSAATILAFSRISGISVKEVSKEFNLFKDQ